MRPLEASQNKVHMTLECGWRIAKSKWHDLEFEEPLSGAKRCFGLVLIGNFTTYEI